MKELKPEEITYITINGVATKLEAGQVLAYPDGATIEAITEEDYLEMQTTGEEISLGDYLEMLGG